MRARGVDKSTSESTWFPAWDAAVHAVPRTCALWGCGLWFKRFMTHEVTDLTVVHFRILLLILRGYRQTLTATGPAL